MEIYLVGSKGLEQENRKSSPKLSPSSPAQDFPKESKNSLQVTKNKANYGFPFSVLANWSGILEYFGKHTFSSEP